MFLAKLFYVDKQRMTDWLAEMLGYFKQGENNFLPRVFVPLD